MQAIQPNSHDTVQVNLHDSQALIQLINANVTYCLWQRGGGKTSGGIGPRLMHLSEVMPRSQVLLFSDTYERLVDRIVPNIIHFWEDKLGWQDGVDYVKYKKPPEHWDKPFIPLDKFDKVITTSTGLSICLVSLAVEGSANAFNAVAAIGDEVKFCDEEKIDAEVLPALRGSEHLYGNMPEYLSVWMFTDKFGPKVKWLLRKRKLVDKEAIEAVYVLQCEIIRLEKLLTQYTSSSTKAPIIKQIDELRTLANRMRKQLVYVSEMKPYENLAALGEFYFKRARRIAKTEYVFKVAYLNEDPDKVEHTFYPTLSDDHMYSNMNDIDPTEPFIAAMDYNFRISPMPVAQLTRINDHAYISVNIVDYLWELYPLGIEDTIKSFCKKYESHINKEVHFIYDHTAKGRSASKRTFIEIVESTFDDEGWTCVLHYIGKTEDHDIKFESIKQWLFASGEWSVWFNKVRTHQLTSAMGQTPVIMSGGESKKDKRKEKDPDFPAEDAPHGPDALDTLLIGLFDHDIKDDLDSVAMGMGAR